MHLKLIRKALFLTQQQAAGELSARPVLIESKEAASKPTIIKEITDENGKTYKNQFEYLRKKLSLNAVSAKDNG